MPRGDRTGPLGVGPMTGRRLGFCVGNDRPGFDTESRNFGHGNGWRRRMGFGQRYAHGRFSEDEVHGVSQKTLLENDARILKEQLASIEEQLSEINKGTD